MEINEFEKLIQQKNIQLAEVTSKLEEQANYMAMLGRGFKNIKSDLEIASGLLISVLRQYGNDKHELTLKRGVVADVEGNITGTIRTRLDDNEDVVLYYEVIKDKPKAKERKLGLVGKMPDPPPNREIKESDTTGGEGK